MADRLLQIYSKRIILRLECLYSSCLQVFYMKTSESYFTSPRSCQAVIVSGVVQFFNMSHLLTRLSVYVFFCISFKYQSWLPESCCWLPWMHDFIAHTWDYMRTLCKFTSCRFWKRYWEYRTSLTLIKGHYE